MHEAQINLLQLLKALDPDGGTLMPDLRRQVEQTIRDQSWTTEGMQLIQV